MYLAFYKGRKSENSRADWFDFIVCLFTSSRYSHVEILTEYDEETGEANAWSSTHRNSGIRMKHMNVHTNSWEVFRIKTDRTKEEVKDWFIKRDHHKYDWFGVLGVVLPFKFHKKRRWFCSEAVAASLGMRDPSKLTPELLWQSVTLLYRSH